jgi:PhnB protein
MSLTTQVSFDGNCAEALHFYAATFGGHDVFLMTWAVSPMAAQAPAGWEDKILYGRVSIGAYELLGGDAPPGSYRKPQGMTLHYGPKDIADAQRIFAALSEGGTVILPLRETFWSKAYGIVTDRFGVPWELNCE